MTRVFGLLKEFNHPCNGRQLEIFATMDDHYQINCGCSVEIVLFGKLYDVSIELDPSTNRYYGITHEGERIRELNNLTAVYSNR